MNRPFAVASALSAFVLVSLVSGWGWVSVYGGNGWEESAQSPAPVAAVANQFKILSMFGSATMTHRLVVDADGPRRERYIIYRSGGDSTASTQPLWRVPWWPFVLAAAVLPVLWLRRWHSRREGRRSRPGGFAVVTPADRGVAEDPWGAGRQGGERRPDLRTTFTPPAGLVDS